METTQCLPSKQQCPMILVGDLASKRSEYFTKAAKDFGLGVKVIPWTQLESVIKQVGEHSYVKLDPPPSCGALLETLPDFIEAYQKQLNRLQEIKGMQYSNSPFAVLETLDKKKCKKRLEVAGIPTTTGLEIQAKNYQQLVEELGKRGLCRVFLKLNYGSGAAGVVALQINPKTRQGIAYTSLNLDENNKLINTKKLLKWTKQEFLDKMITKLLDFDLIVERWESKAKYQGKSYDLRVVCQFGKVAYLLARSSKGPITNLHLNHGAIAIEDLSLEPDVIANIHSLALETMDCFTGLEIAGIDILVTPSGRLKVIEVNAQGDQIYQDMYQENKIYKQQIQHMISNIHVGQGERL